MKVFIDNDRNHLLFITPGIDPKLKTPALLQANGAPRDFTVRFVDGVAEVSDELGKYLIDKGNAKADAEAAAKERSE